MAVIQILKYAIGDLQRAVPVRLCMRRQEELSEVFLFLL